MSKEDWKKFTLRYPHDLHNWLENKSQETGISKAVLIRLILTEAKETNFKVVIEKESK